MDFEGYYRAGPALEGTACGTGLWCHGGKCVKNVKKPVSNSHLMINRFVTRYPYLG